MISLIATFDPPRLPLLRRFVGHYRAYGVGAFYISLHFDSVYATDLQAGVVERANSILGGAGLRLHSVYACPHDAAVVRRHHDAVQSQIAAVSPWVVWADSDEFHEFSDHLSLLTAHMGAHSVDYIEGVLVDRMARQGFPALCDGVSPWRQYPLGTDISSAVVKGWVRKVMVSRSTLRVGTGNHRVESPAGASRLAGTYPVHHFKWDASVVTRLQRRLEDDWKQRCPWWRENRNALRWIAARGCDSFAGLSVFDFEDDLRGDDGGPLSGNMRYLSNQRKAADRGGGPSVGAAAFPGPRD